MELMRTPPEPFGLTYGINPRTFRISTQEMSAEVKKEIELEIAHVLFIAIVGYSKLCIDEERDLIDTLNQLVRGSAEFRSGEDCLTYHCGRA
jgi:hypothetical protein